eukprot:373328-Prorocentrum_minimum.AAC.4
MASRQQTRWIVKDEEESVQPTAAKDVKAGDPTVAPARHQRSRDLEREDLEKPRIESIIDHYSTQPPAVVKTSSWIVKDEEEPVQPTAAKDVEAGDPTVAPARHQRKKTCLCGLGIYEMFTAVISLTLIFMVTSGKLLPPSTCPNTGAARLRNKRSLTWSKRFWVHLLRSQTLKALKNTSLRLQTEWLA